MRWSCITITCTIFDVGENKEKSETGDIVEPGKLTSQLNAAIGLPASLFQEINDRL